MLEPTIPAPTITTSAVWLTFVSWVTEHSIAPIVRQYMSVRVRAGTEFLVHGNLAGVTAFTYSEEAWPFAVFFFPQTRELPRRFARFWRIWAWRENPARMQWLPPRRSPISLSRS